VLSFHRRRTTSREQRQESGKIADARGQRTEARTNVDDELLTVHGGDLAITVLESATDNLIGLVGLAGLPWLVGLVRFLRLAG
jgi:hypothetical protein